MTVSSTSTVLKPKIHPVTMPSSESVWGRRMSLMPSLSWKKGSEIQIVLDGENHFIHTYSTSDEISGYVNLKFEKETCIDDFTITLQGQTITWVEKIATTSPTMGRTTGKHTFLKVQQPIDQNCLPEFNQAKAGQIYTIPFQFVVPDRILDFTCNHRVDRDEIKDTHLLLPPSLGDPMLSGRANTLMDDLAPNMSRISYSIRVGLLKASPTVRRSEMLEEHIGIRIVPAREEEPPLSLAPRLDRRPGQFCLRKEKNVRKGILRIGKKQGSLIAETEQPSSLKLSHPSREGEEPVTTMTTIRLRFDPANPDEQPPSLSCISNKLNVHTFFGAAPWVSLPAPDTYDLWSTVHSQYPQTIDLSSRNLSNVEWVKHQPGSVPTPTHIKPDPLTNAERRQSRLNSTAHPSAAPGNLPRRVSTFSTISSSSSASSSDNDSHSSTSSNLNLSQPPTLSIPSPSTSYNPSLPYYTTSIIVPITLPTTSSSSSSPSQPTATTISPTISRRQSTMSTATTPLSTSQPRRQSTFSTLSSLSSTSTSNTNAPQKQKSNRITFIPTFHSCLISRVYSLELSVSSHGAPTMNLRIPIQISLPHTPNTSSRTATPPAVLAEWSNPFSTVDEIPEYTPLAQTSNQNPTSNANPTQTRPEQHEDDYIQLANDEALARALQSPSPLLSSQNRSPPDVPEYSFVGGSSRRAQDDLPPEYHSSFRRVSAARHAALNGNGNGNGNASGSGSGSGNVSGRIVEVHTQGERRRFSLLL